MAEEWLLLLTCEHGGNKIPRAYQAAMTAADKTLLPTHRGWDAGALAVAKQLAKDVDGTLFSQDISRLLVDCNRTISHKYCFGPVFQEWDPLSKARIADAYYWPYRLSVENHIRHALKSGRKVLHCAVHSFTPVMNGVIRNADFGLLYDPGRSSEKTWADRIVEGLRQETDWAIRRNYPYLGKSDGFTRYLRKQFPSGKYAGFEWEFNQRILQSPAEVKAAAKSCKRLFSHLDIAFV